MNNGEDTYILCQVAETVYALASHEIKHLEMVEHVTPVPGAAPFVDGVIFSRGQVVAAVNLRRRFGLPDAPYTPQTRLIVTRSHGRQVGLIVDSARQFRKIPANAIQPIDEAVVGIGRHFLRGIAEVEKRLVLLFDLDAILKLDDLPDEEVAEQAVAADPHSQNTSLS